MAAIVGGHCNVNTRTGIVKNIFFKVALNIPILSLRFAAMEYFQNGRVADSIDFLDSTNTKTSLRGAGINVVRLGLPSSSCDFKFVWL